LEKQGRSPDSVRRTLMHRITIGATDADVARKTDGLDVDELKSRGALIGTPNEVAQRLIEFEAAGVQRIMGQMYDMTDLDGVELLAANVLPQLK
jgi:alkanesulfonate monooxygenase SsuD/methylene tetrahydromethanopterin reductase-like flavin-dependent oxidoreductase (luciferase family)